MKHFLKIALAALALMGMASPALAAEPGKVELLGKVMLERTVNENGQTRSELTEPKIVVPGDRLIFTTRYVNNGEEPAENLVITNPLPDAVTLAADTPADLVVSVDGGKTWGKLAELSVADGQGGKRPALTSDVTHIRWTLATIPAGASGEFGYNAIVR